MNNLNQKSHFHQSFTTESFLLRSEMVELTGYIQKARQIEQLSTQGIPMILGRDGHPKVLRSNIEQRLGVNSSQQNCEKEPTLFNK